MTKPILSLIILFSTFAGMCQTSLTIGEIYDFEVGDKFQTHGIAENQPPNADRVTIVAKWYSGDNDTVAYARYHDKYTSTLSGGWPPEVIYNGTIFTDTVYYTDLNLDFMQSSQWEICDSTYEYCDTIMEVSAEYCDSLILGQNYAQYPIYNFYLMGKGLGRVLKSISYADGGGGYTTELFYYEKNGIGCGNPDNLVVSVRDIMAPTDVILGPNPADDHFKLHTDVGGPLIVEVFTVTGKRVQTQSFSSHVFDVECSNFNPGIYIVTVTSENNKYIRKLVKR